MKDHRVKYFAKREAEDKREDKMVANVFAFSMAVFFLIVMILGMLIANKII